MVSAGMGRNDSNWSKKKCKETTLLEKASEMWGWEFSLDIEQ